MEKIRLDGQVLRKYRNKMYLTQSELAKLCHLSREFINRGEHNNSPTTYKTILLLSNVLQCPVDALILND